MTKTKVRHSFILLLCLFFLISFSLILFGWLKIDANEKRIQLNELNLRNEALIQENEQLDYYINEADEDEVYEHLARERGYAYPDEKVYFNMTPGN